MAAAKTGSRQGKFVNERQLLYGTSPEIVEAICNQNFDCGVFMGRTQLFTEKEAILH